ncbi:MAG: ATP synthase F1 subunit delta [Dehalococcoidia bacterium]|nr:ATP synthase F1 subunit delta [Dehalococcoidia bacterium]
MADPQAAKRYAQAALAIAREDGTVTRWRADLADIANVLSRSEAAPIFADGRIPLDQRLAMVERTLDVAPKALNLARLLVSKGRSAEAEEVASAFNRMADELEGIVDARITTAIELDTDQLKEVEGKLSASLGNRPVRTTAIVDPAILGGMIVRVGDRVVDGSVRTRLKRLRQELQGAR